MPKILSSGIKGGSQLFAAGAKSKGRVQEADVQSGAPELRLMVYARGETMHSSQLFRQT